MVAKDPLDHILNSSPPINRPHAAIRCVDGFTISVQASPFHAALTAHGGRPDLDLNTAALPWTSVECSFPSDRPEPWTAWQAYADCPEEPTESVYCFVPASMVRDLIDRHGGCRMTATIPPRTTVGVISDDSIPQIRRVGAYIEIPVDPTHALDGSRVVTVHAGINASALAHSLLDLCEVRP